VQRISHRFSKKKEIEKAQSKVTEGAKTETHKKGRKAGGIFKTTVHLLSSFLWLFLRKVNYCAANWTSMDLSVMVRYT